ncbi:MAG: class I SAM-dependent methyltransferase [Candidatus Eremiobacteraeota bacterium]|nr:class I SAM-dependent methyltransferase [Candidatus Eremiobacteraeota bacterium]MCL5054647.1 class I SAM-dependent methyltransferase [Bacillota bacterium]
MTSGNINNHQKEAERIQSVYSYYDSTQKVQIRRDQNNRGNQFMHKERIKAIVFLLNSYGWLPFPKSFKILDIGCGNGGFLGEFCIKQGAEPSQLYGIDLLPNRIEQARKNYPEINWICGNSEKLKFDSSTFDLIAASDLFSSILDNGMATQLASEINRVLKPGGAVLWYDFRYNNPQNPHVRGMTKKRIFKLFPHFIHHIQSITLAPPLARHLGVFTSVLYPVLSCIPFLRSHYVGLLLKPAEQFNPSHP